MKFKSLILAVLVLGGPASAKGLSETAFERNNAKLNNRAQQQSGSERSYLLRQPVPEHYTVIFDKPGLNTYLHLQKTNSQPKSVQLQSVQILSLQQHRQQISLQQQEFLQQAGTYADDLVVNNQFDVVLNGVSISTSKLTKEQLLKLPYVSRVEPAVRISTLLDNSVKRTQADQVWLLKDLADRNITGTGVKVAIIDSGIDYSHPDLGGCFGVGCRVVAGYDFVNQDNDPMDDNGHGTHVAGIVAANGGLRGVAPDAVLYAYKAMDANGLGFDTDIIAAIDKAIIDGVDIINMSLGGVGGPDSLLSMAVNEAAKAGVLVVVAAGNSGPGLGTIESPANARLALTVGAVDNNGIITNFSSRGPVADADYIKPDIVAPGFQINSSHLNRANLSLNGTSMAAPHVAGAAALLKQLYPHYSREMLQQAIVSGVTPATAAPLVYGAGELNVLNAATPELLFSKSTLFFGHIDGGAAQWQHTQQFEIQNISAHEQELRFTPGNNFPVGLTLTGVPQNALMLQPMQRVTLTLSLSADNAQLGFPISPALTFDDVLKINTEQRDYAIGLVVQKSIPIDIQATGGYVTKVKLQRLADNSLYELDAYSPSVQLAVLPGEYRIVASSVRDDVVRILMLENYQVNDKLQLDLSAFSYPNIVTVDQIFTLEGRHLSQHDLESRAIIVSLQSSAEQDELLFYQSNLYPEATLDYPASKEQLALSHIPTEYTLDVYLAFADTSDPDRDDFYHFIVNRQGVSEPVQLSLVAAEVPQWRFDLDRDELGVQRFQIVHEYQSNMFGKRYYSSGFGSFFDSAKYEMRVFGKNLTESKMYSFGLVVTDEESSLLYSSGAMVFDGNRVINKLDRNIDERELGKVLHQLSTQYDSATLPFLFASAIVRFEVGSFNLSNYDQYSEPFFKNEHHSYRNNMAELNLSCNSEPYLTQRFTGKPLHLALPTSCQLVEFDLTTNYGRDTTEGSYALSGKQSIEETFPIIRALHFINDGMITRMLDGTVSMMEFKVSLFGSSVLPAIPQVFIKLQNTDLWQPLPVHQAGDSFSVTLPDLDKKALASIKIILQGSRGGYQQHLLSDVITLGKPATNESVMLRMEVYGAGSIRVKGIDCSSYCETAITVGNKVALNAASRPGYYFKGWNLPECGARLECEITLEQSTEVKAYFDVERYPSTFSYSGAGTVTSLSSMIFYGSPLRYSVLPAKGYQVKRQVKGNCPPGVWLDDTTYQTGAIGSVCGVIFEFIKIKRKGIPLWLLVPQEK